MKINTKLEEAVWIDFNKVVSIKMRALSLDNLMLLETDFKDHGLVARKMGQYIIMDWKGFEDEDGNKFECNDDNKTYLLNFYPEFKVFISEEIEKLKNLKTHPVKKISKK